MITRPLPCCCIRSSGVRGWVMCLALLLALAAAPVRADGLFYHLPEDGVGVKFALNMNSDAGGQERVGTGSLTMSSVGKQDVDGEPHRFIEFKMIMQVGDREQVIVAKALMPEKELKRGGRPWDNFKKAWVKMGDSEAKKITEVVGNDAGPLPAFLSGPLDNETKLAAVDVESGLGTLACDGLTGDVSVADGNMKVNVTFENRLHQKAPFGVVTSTMVFRVERDGQQREGGTLELKVESVVKDARSELPDLQ